MSARDQAHLWAWNEVLDRTSYYELLGVLEIADDAAIKDAFHAFCLAFHPDAHEGADAETLALCGRIFARGAEAYRTLMSLEGRANYDLALAKGELRLMDGTGGEPAPRGAGSARSLDELAQSAAAKRSAQRAHELIGQGDLQGAKRELKMAIYQDGGSNPALEERLDDLETALFAQGD